MDPRDATGPVPPAASPAPPPPAIAPGARLIRERRARDSTPTGRRLAALSLLALGVVFGDIGTSPLYAFREAFHHETGLGSRQVSLAEEQAPIAILGPSVAPIRLENVAGDVASRYDAMEVVRTDPHRR